MGRHAAVVPYVVAIVVLVVGADLVFFRHQFWPRLLSNVGVVLVVGAFYLRYHPR